MKGKPILCLDFDGVVHDYKKGWGDGSIYGDFTPGFLDWAERAALVFDLVIHTSRAKDKDGAQAVMRWLIDRCADAGVAGMAGLFEVTAVKPAAFLSIDDRGLRFDGDWSDPAFAPDVLRAFKPWMIRTEFAP